MAIDAQQLHKVIQSFVIGTSHVQGAALVTPDGLPLSGKLPEGLSEAKVAAMAAAAMTIGDRIGHELQRGSIQHILVEGSEGFSILTLCGSDTLLLVLASLEAKQGILLLEVRRMVEEIARIIQ